MRSPRAVSPEPPQRTVILLISRAVFPSELAAGLISHAKMEPDQEGAFDKSFIPAERTGSETDMGGTILYMASKAGAYLNGVIHVIDGGRLGGVPSTY